MVTAVCLNPCVDRTVWLDALEVGGTNRVLRERSVPGGKGINVACALVGQGVPACVTVLAGREGIAYLEATLRPLGCEVCTLEVPDEMRVNIKIFDQSRSEVTELNAAGSVAPQPALDAMVAMVASGAQGSAWLVLSGSLPPGCPPGYYARLIRMARAVAPGCLVALDAEGESFRLGVAEGPDLVKPNRHELALFWGREVQTPEDALHGALALQRAGAKDAIVSLGADGALLCTQRVRLLAEAISVKVESTVASGDALLAGYLAGQIAGLEPPEAFRWGVASATAKVAGEPEKASAYRGRVVLREIDLG